MRISIALMICALLAFSWPSVAQVPATHAGLGTPATGGGGTALTLTASPAPLNGGSSLTFSGLSIGAAAASRIVIACVEVTASGSPTTTAWVLTASGGTMIQALNLYDTGGHGVGIYYAAIPTGTTSDFTVTATTGTIPNINGTQIAIYSMTGLSGAPLSTGNKAWGVTFSTMSVTATVTNFGIECFGTDRTLSPTWSSGTVVDFHQNNTTTGADIFAMHTTSSGSQTPTSSTVTTNYDAAMAAW